MLTKNKKPVYYLQTDSRWGSTRLPCVGGTMSIKGGGCGPTSAAMLIETLTGKTCLPTETMKWACEHKFVYANQGTDYGYFRPQFAEYNLECNLLTSQVCLSANSPVRDKVIQYLKKGYYFIALMKKGLWTSGGHYIVVWWADNKIRINDPASTKEIRLNGDPDTFFSQAKYFWWVDARKYNDPNFIEEIGMNTDEFIESLTDKQSIALFNKINAALCKRPLPKNWEAEKELQEAVDMGITDGSNPMGLALRLDTQVMTKRAVSKGNK